MTQGSIPMSFRLKATLGALILLAVFFGYRVAVSFLPNGTGQDSAASVPRGALTATIGGADIPDDSDHDGLGDDDETKFETNYRDADSDNDGYFDGEEVTSGYDPNKAKDDQLHGAANLTELYAKNLLNGILAGDLDPKNQGTQAYMLGQSALTYAVLTEANDMLASDPMAEKIRVIPLTQESSDEYRQFLEQTFTKDESFSTRHNDQPFEIARAFKLIREEKRDEGLAILYGYQSLYDQKMRVMAGTPVPEPFSDMHRSLGVRFSMLANAYGALALSMEHNDFMMRNVALKVIADNIAGMRDDLIGQLKKLANIK